MPWALMKEEEEEEERVFFNLAWIIMSEILRLGI
jgi:hypothetical protein